MISANQLLLKGILENNQSFLFAVNHELQYIWFNIKYAEKIKESYKIKIHTGMRIPSCIDLNHQYEMKSALKKSLNGESLTIVRKSRELKDKNGSFEFYFYPIYEEQKIIGAACQITDVTERVQYDRQKFENLKLLFERRLNGFSNIIPDFVVISTPDGVRKFANQSYLDFYETDEESMIGKSYFDKITNAERDDYLNNLKRISKDSPSITHVHLLTSPSGNEQWVLWTETAVFDSNGDFMELLSIGRNVDDMVKAKEMREEYIEILETTIFKTSHQVRQPISNILGLAQIMEKENYSPTELEFIINYFKESADKLDEFTKELTSFIHESIQNNRSKL